MTDWTPWQIVGLIAVLALSALGLTAIAAWYMLTRRRRELSDLAPDERAARLLGETVAKCGGELEISTLDELFAVFARSSSDQKQAIVAAIRGLFAAASDGPHNIPDVNDRVLAIGRRLGGSGP